MKLGLDERNKDLEDSRKQQIVFVREKEERKIKADVNELEIRSEQAIDYDFSNLDEALAMEKLKAAAFKYDGRLSEVRARESSSCLFVYPCIRVSVLFSLLLIFPCYSHLYHSIEASTASPFPLGMTQTLALVSVNCISTP